MFYSWPCTDSSEQSQEAHTPITSSEFRPNIHAEVTSETKGVVHTRGTMKPSPRTSDVSQKKVVTS